MIDLNRMDKLTLITSTRIAEIDFTADDWELFDHPGANHVAAELNTELKRCVNSGMTRGETERAMHDVMTRAADWGARDSEPQYFLESLLRRIYGDD